MGERMRAFLERVKVSLRQRRSRIVLLVVLIAVVLVALLSVTLGMMSQEEDLGPAPGAPANLAAEATSASRVDLIWQDNSDNESGFRIERLTGTGGGGSYAIVDEVGADVFIYSDIGLVGDTPYYYRVRALGRGGNSPYSNIVAVKTLILTPPNAPTNLGAEAMASGWIDLSWWDQSDTEAGFKVMRRAEDGIYRQVAKVEANVNQYSDIGLTESTEYYYQVLAYNHAGDSRLSNEAGEKTLEPTYHIWGGTAMGTRLHVSVSTFTRVSEFDTWRPGNIHLAPGGSYFAVVPVTALGRVARMPVRREAFILRDAVTHDQFGMIDYDRGKVGKPFVDRIGDQMEGPALKAGETASGVILFLVPKTKPVDELEMVYYLDSSIHIWPAPEQPEA